MYLTPAALSYLSQVILAALISGYFLWLLRRTPRPRYSVCLTIFFCALTGFLVTLFLEAATHYLAMVFLQIPLLSLAWLCFLQFAYEFPELPPAWRLEFRVSLGGGGLYTLWEIGYAVFRFARLRAGVVEYRIDWTDYLLLLFLLWPALVFIRQVLRLAPPTARGWQRGWAALRRPANPEARALRAFALIALFVAALSLFNLLRTFYLLPVALANLGIAVGILLALFAFASAYLNQRTESTSFMVKLAGLTLTATLAIMGAVGWVISPAYEALYHPDLTAPRALRFTPNAGGGYDVATIPYAFETELGRDLALDDGPQRGCSEGLAFAFPFYGQDFREIYVCNDGVIALGQAVRYREFQYRYGAGVPLLLPLLLDLDPTISPGGVFARQTADRLIVTWDRLRAFRQPEAEFTFQAVLYADGRCDFIYKALPDTLDFEPNDDPDASLWAVGAIPGDRCGPAPRQVTLRALPVSGGPEGIVQDFRLEFSQHLHRLLAPLAALILVASALIVGGFPWLFYANLVGPLNALLAGVRRIEAGDYAAAAPVQFPDEIGFLTRAFNTLSAELGDLIHTLETRVQARTAALDAANAHLRAEIAGHEQAQTLLVEQQRALARLEEREQLGRELHDGLGQVLGYINVQTQAAQALLDEGRTAAAHDVLSDVILAAQDAHTDIRAHILGLRAQETPPQDFFTTLQAYLAQFGQRYHVVARLSAPTPFPPAVFAPAVEEQVIRILQEGLTNACKHGQAHTLEVTFSFVGDRAQIIIADDGVGFEARERMSESADQRISDAASQPSILSPQPSVLSPQSSALSPQSSVLSPPQHFGLHIMRERAAQVGGALEIRAAPGQGTRLFLTVPRFLPTQEDADAAALQRLRILLADDHPLFLSGLHNLLVARGLTIIGLVYDGQEAIEKTRALRPDVVVMDLNMPNVNGLEALRTLKAEFPDIKVVILTAAEDEAALFEALKAGASGYLLKNLDANQFCALLAGLLRDEAPLSPGLATRVLAEFARLANAAPDAAPEASAALSAQQWAILRHVTEGLTYKEIAARLYITEKTVKYHMAQILERLHLENRVQAITYYQQHNGRDAS